AAKQKGDHGEGQQKTRGLIACSIPHLFLGPARHFLAATADLLPRDGTGAARLLGLRLLLLLALLLAVDAEGGDRAGEQALEADLLAAVFALVDRALIEATQRLVDLPEEELLAVAQAQLGREDLLFHRLVDGVATDVALAIHAEGEPVLGVFD